MHKTRALIRRPLRLLGAVFLAVFSLAAFTPELRAQERVVSLEEAYSLALENHEDLGIARENVNQAKTDLTKSVARILPNITAEGSYTRYTESKSSGTNFVT